MKAITYLGFSRNTEMEENITNQNIKDGYTKVICYECQGSKIFTYPDKEIVSCLNCKGTGKIYINC